MTFSRKKIVLIAPKSFNHTVFTLDYAYWNFYIPLLELGHSVHFFDTVKYGNQDLEDYINKNNPDLLFCIMTGNSNAFPNEPWDAILQETKKGKVLTFNWFCDDSWRFNNFSSQKCHYFHFCSTPEKQYVSLYKNLGYNNIIYATWHANIDLYSAAPNKRKQVGISFVGNKGHGNRIKYLDLLKNNELPIFSPVISVGIEAMIQIHTQSFICLNFADDYSEQNTQMKARMFEVPATGSLLFTQNTPNLENCFNLNDEVVTFSDPDEMLVKLRKLINDENMVTKIALKGHERVKRDHDSKIRLAQVLEELYENRT